MAQTYTLYGSYASYYTAKSRSYLRKKGIPFVERLPSDPMFRNKVRPTSGSHRIPQLLTPDGHVLQDSVEILDHLERMYPELPAFPTSPVQRTFVHLMELLGSEGLLRLAWLHRWVFPENRAFVIKDFGRSFKPQGDDAELDQYGNLIADRMMSYGLPESTAEIRAALDADYVALLELFDAHFQHHPYLLGGHPSAADYAVMGALHAHLGRDPAGLRAMQEHGPRTFRWVEQMLLPEVQSPEFFSRAVNYPADDEVPETALAIARFIACSYGLPFVLNGLAFDQVMERSGATAGYELSPKQDQPTLPPEEVNYGGNKHAHSSSVYAVWLAQRSQRYFQSQEAETQTQIQGVLADELLSDLLNMPVRYPLERIKNRLVIASE